MDVICKRCHGQPETLGPVLGLCQFTKGLRIKWHNKVEDILANKLRQRNKVFVELTVMVGDNRYKPDLIVTNEGRLLLVDVTVRYENRDYLLKACKEKGDKYFPCLNHLKTI